MAARPPLRGLFVTGTDTGVGKTAVSVALLRLAHRAGQRLVPFKPVETGCRGRPPQDASRLLAAACRPDLDLDLVCPFRFDPPVAPAAAAREQPLRPAQLTDSARRLAAHGDAVLVEGAGGLLSPYCPDFTAADFAALLGLPVLLVARNGLGTINHTVLCLRELARQRLPVAGLVLVNTSRQRTPDRRTNAELIFAQTGLRPLALMPFVRAQRPDALADALAASAATLALLRALTPAGTGSPARGASSGK
jgi:dethiobiotin synthetase